MQNQPHVLLVVTSEKKQDTMLIHCHFNGEMTTEEKQALMQGLIKTVEQMISGDLTDKKVIRVQNQLNS